MSLSDEEKKEILETYNWIKVKKFKDDPDLSWQERFSRLEAHHLEETNYLIHKIRELVQMIDTEKKTGDS